MRWKRLGAVALASGLALGVAGCNDGYGYSGVAVGYGSPGYYGDGYGYDGYGYGDPYYGGYGYGAGTFGWYNDFYYPGAGVYVYDRYRRPHRWNDGQRRYWEGRRGRGDGRYNWGGFDRPGDGHGYPGRGYAPGHGYDGRGYDGRGGGDNWHDRDGFRPNGSDHDFTAPAVQNAQPGFRPGNRPQNGFGGHAAGGFRGRPGGGFGSHGGSHFGGGHGGFSGHHR